MCTQEEGKKQGHDRKIFGYVQNTKNEIFFAVWRSWLTLIWKWWESESIAIHSSSIVSVFFFKLDFINEHPR